MQLQIGLAAETEKKASKYDDLPNEYRAFPSNLSRRPIQVYQYVHITHIEI